MPRRSRRSAPDHPIDWQQASRFHQHIHGPNETEYRFIKPGRPTIHKWGDLLDVTNPHHQALADMQRLNDDGYGVYIVINHVDPTVATKIKEGRGGATDTDITTPTALFVDIDRDEQTPGANLSMLEDAEVPPSLIVQSSTPNKVHAYWFLDPGTCPLDLWRRLQAQLIAHFGADPACKNPSRIMRAPGFWHHKNQPIQTRILSSPGTVYEVAELVELFDLDPELEIGPDRPTELPAGYTPPAVELLLNRPFTRRLINQVLRTDKRRHNTILWWAQHLRENGINIEDAQASAATFAGLLPARTDGPVEAAEVESAITWAYAKEAGRNRPVRQTGLEAVAVDGGSSGKSRVSGSTAGGSGSRQPDDDLEEITRAAHRPPLTIQAGGYAKVRDTRDGPVTSQLTNWTFTPNLALRWPDGSIGHRGTLAVNTTDRHTIDLPARAWASRRDLLTILAPYNANLFSNANQDVAQIQQFILNEHPQLPTATGVTTYGLHHHKGQWRQLYQDTHDPELFYAGTPVDPGPSHRSLTPGTETDVEAARNTIRLLPTLITPSAALALLGYATAAAYGPRLTKELGDRLPFLYIAGERESGKSSSIELVLALTTGHPSARLRKAGGLTPYQYDTAFSNLNNRLAALDEYRPGALDDAQLRKHHDLGTKWRGTGIAARDHAYNLNTPLIVAGEGFTEDAAALSRGPLYFITKDDRGPLTTYLQAQQTPNTTYAHHLANTAANLPETTHQQRLQHARQLAQQAAETRGGPRLQFALTYIAYGLLHLQADIPNYLTDTTIQKTLEVGVAQTLDGGDETKTNVETFLEQLGPAIAEAKDPNAYAIPGYVTNTLIIRISPAVELVRRRYGRDAGLSNAKMLRRYAQKLDWIDASPTHKAVGNTTARGLRIDLKAAPDRCDLSALEYIEERLRNPR